MLKWVAYIFAKIANMKTLAYSAYVKYMSSQVQVSSLKAHCHV